MNHFKMICFLSLSGSIVFWACGVSLIIAFLSNLRVPAEIQAATNFDNMHIGIITCGVTLIVFSLIMFFGFTVTLSLISERGCKRNNIIAEALYLLGLYSPYLEPIAIGSKYKIDEPTPSETSSVNSVFGFGLDDNDKWTFAGRTPNGLKEPISESTSDIAKRTPIGEENDSPQSPGSDSDE